MNQEQKEAHNRAVENMERFKWRAIIKGDKGIEKFGGGLARKNNFRETLNESYDLTQYLMELENQIDDLISHAQNAADILENSGVNTESLRAAIQPFLEPTE
jgi:hypothetical protein